MSEHRFKVGQALHFTPARQDQTSCEVVRLLSSDSDDPKYRVKCVAEIFDRVVQESELS